MFLPTRFCLTLFVLGLFPLLIDGMYRIISGSDSAFSGWVVLFVLAFDGAVFLLFLFDAWLTRRLRKLRVQREVPQRLSVGVTNEIVLLLENLGDSTLSLIIRDQPPLGCRVEPNLLRTTIPAHGWVRLHYDLTPPERGNIRFGDVAVRLSGFFGLALVDKTLSAAQEAQVYPNLQEVRRFESLVRATLVRTGGYHHRRMPGAGKEFSHFREYTRDDDYRHINWRASARRAKPITTVYESEHSQDILFCLDVGRMMAARVGQLTKLDHAINAILMLTHISQRFQDNLGLLIFSHEIHMYLPPAKGRSQYAHFLQALYSVQPDLCYVNYRDAFQHLIKQHPKRALTMIFTDLLDDVVSAEYQEAVKLLKRFHLPLTLAVADVPLRTQAERTPNTVEELYAIQTARDLLHSRSELLLGLERQGVMVVDTVPEKLTIDAVNRYLELKTGTGM